MRKVYLDSAPVIYLVEQTPNFYARVRAQLQPNDWLVVCELTRLEVSHPALATAQRRLAC